MSSVGHFFARRVVGKLSEQEERVARYYDEAIFAAEAERLEQHFPVEFAITARQLGRWVPAGATVAEVGVGVGHYSEVLARRGCRLYLLDVSERLLDAARARLREAGLAGQVIGVDRASATNLESLGAETCDAVLLLGPLYHLCAPGERRRAVSEAARVLRPGGRMLAAGINRLAYLRDLFRERPEEAVARRDFHAKFLRDGNLDPEHAPPIGFAHLTTAAEFRGLFAAEFDELALVAIESFAGPWQAQLAGLSAEAAAAWLELIEQTASTPEALGLTDHFLYIGGKR